MLMGSAMSDTASASESEANAASVCSKTLSHSERTYSGVVSNLAGSSWQMNSFSKYQAVAGEIDREPACNSLSVLAITDPFGSLAFGLPLRRPVEALALG